MRKNILQTRRGFTLIEIILSIALIGIMTASAAPAYHALYLKNDLEVTANTLAHAVHRAQNLSRAVSNDSQWGVSAQNGLLTVFQGTSYANRNTAYDETFTIPSSIQFSQTELVFQKITGELQAPITITLTSSGDTKNISINVKGTITY
ncbi:type II secretion system protein [Candidatus Uhrbacteria bacterium]|nr:type II secretion system protein [Candidatus Uhrbacteria bacterium]